jgi:8-oxo-dGTP diphosphatase
MILQGVPRHVVGLLVRDGLVCAATRRGKKNDKNLVGGKREPGETPEKALAREVLEEAGVEVVEAEWVFERTDETDGGVAWCALVTKWIGEPHTCEKGIDISWEKPTRLLEGDCTFREYNRSLFTQLSML